MASYEDHAAGVADDYRDALEGLTMNSRVEINNLTLIARENTEYAHAISEVVQEHIKKVTPPRKLPALYLLDSIVKNVGTPYTIYFGRGLYATYMDAYASVDNNTRRKMEEMLKTWREPVPGSVDPRPVFQPEATRPIENALIQARTSALQAQHDHLQTQRQLLSRGGRPQVPGPYRETPTPPNARPGPPPPQSGPYGQQPQPFSGPNGNTFSGQPHNQQSYPIHAAQFPARSTPQPPPSAPATLPFQPPGSFPYGAAPGPQPGISIASLNGDIERLIESSKAAFAQNIHDASIQGRLKGLLDLQTLLKSQNLQPDKLMLVKAQIDAMSVNMPGHKAQAATLTPTYHAPPPSSSIPQPVGTPVAPPASAPPAPISLEALLGKGKGSALAALLGQQQSATPPVPVLPRHTPPVVAPISSPQPSGVAAGAASTNTLALMARLRQAGVLPAVGHAPSASPSNPMLAPKPVSLGSGLPGVISPIKPGAARVPLEEIRNDIILKPSSLKQPRLHLLPLLYGDLGPPCTQCGRRFKTDDKGKAEKTAHMDWHFKVHQRIAEAEKRGSHRSWYLHPAEWIRYREAVNDTDNIDPAPDTGVPSSASAAAAPQQWIPVPEGGAGTNTVCPICQERFEMKWLDEAQEWVWMDAVQVGNRVYHASCHVEATRVDDDHRAQPPPVVLGKRKAGGEHAWRGKAKMDGKVDLNNLEY